MENRKSRLWEGEAALCGGRAGAGPGADTAAPPPSPAAGPACSPQLGIPPYRGFYFTL